MVQSQFSLSWDAYKSSICSGFSALQQNGELVDMTLAADGHFVKVHQVLMALVSPYLKELITSAPCQHPVIFLNNVSHKTLSALLEYIYTGEVLVPSENLGAFVETAKNLRIRGLENLRNTDNVGFKVVDTSSQFEDIEMCHVSGIKRLGFATNSGFEQIEVPAAARKIFIKRDELMKSKIKTPKKEATEMTQATSDSHDFTAHDDVMDDTVNDSDDYGTPKPSTRKSQSCSASNLQYSISIRGALQIILNRYIYNMFSTKSKNGIRRWRCVDYRNMRCKAFVVTKGNVVLNRANLHNHPFHDKKILQKIEKQSVFSALEEIANYKDKLDKEEEKGDESSVEFQGYDALDLDDAMPDGSKGNQGLEPIE
ncbi:uncharacterized protein LOC113226920 [Hyposmocoma kahamanoa]|uniref:uncharacterized protein LOC113226920 n=1 Tax=Hyposmocoma kahamanoa TaxID=1477025 RepID=UPI000E6D9430|nr:uncharacterized protein LOC113226920 [Hyposmocoma kahamanoa]